MAKPPSYRNYNSPPRMPRSAKTPFMERHSTVFVGVAAATFVAGSFGLPHFMDWFTTREKTTIEALPPTGRVDRYSALVTGTATSDFPVTGSTDCGGVGGMNVENQWHAVATIANKIGDFVVNASPDKTQVTITLEKFPQLESGLQMDKSETSSGESSWLTACSGGDIIRVGTAMMEVAQATADTIGDCIVKRPDFQQGLQDQLRVFGETAYPEAIGNVQVNMPQNPSGISESLTALSALREEMRGRGISIESDAIDNCEFEEFSMTPIVFVPGANNG